MRGPPQSWPRHWLVDRRKITAYLLDPDHPRGASKATFFRKHGFSRDQPDRLADALRAHRTGYVTTRQDNDDDVTIIVEGPLAAPDGRTPLVRSIWQIDPLGDARFITAYPIRKFRS